MKILGETRLYLSQNGLMLTVINKLRKRNLYKMSAYIANPFLYTFLKLLVMPHLYEAHIVLQLF